MKNLVIFYSLEDNTRLIESTIPNNNKETMKKPIILIKELIE